MSHCGITWCKISGPHAGLHYALVALLADVLVAVRMVGGPAEVTVTARETVSMIAGIPPAVLTPTVARCLGQALAARDAELGELLARAADLAESGGAR